MILKIKSEDQTHSSFMWLIHFSEIEDRENEGKNPHQIIKNMVKFF